jgi:hypothetical protein
MRLATLTLALMLGFSAFAQDVEGPPKPPPRMPADESPTHYACTLERLLRSQRCTYEFDPKPGEQSDSVARGNSQAAAAAAKFCPAAATPQDEHHPDALLRKMCEDEIANVSLNGCTLEGKVPFSDAQGHLAIGAQECAESLGHVLARTQTMAAFSLPCCRCLSESNCSVAPLQCNREIVDLSPSDALQSCLDKSCSSACSVANRPDPYPALPPLPPLPSAPKQRARKSSAQQEPALKI